MITCMALQDAVRQSVLRLSQRHLAAAFCSWQQYAAEAAELWRLQQLAVNRMATMRMGATLLAWQRAVQERRALKALMKRAVQ